MIRGIAIGFLGGGVLGLVFAAVVSLVSPLPARVEFESQPVTSVAQPTASSQTVLANPSTADAPVSVDSAAAAPEAQESADATPQADVSSAPKPTPSAINEVEAAPSVESASGVDVTTDEPVFPTPQANAIEVPTDPPENAPVSLRPVLRPQVSTSTQTALLAPPAIAESPAAPTTINVIPETTRATDAETPIEVVDDVNSEALSPPSAGVQTSLLQSATDLDEAFPQLRSNRLPTVDPSQIAADASGIGPGSPLIQFATKYERINTRPILSVVLIDEGKSDLDLSILREFPFPVSIAVNPNVSNAQERARQFRAAGLEVLALLELPEGVKPGEVEANLAAGLKDLPEAVAILEGAQSGLQQSREVSDQVIAYVKASGHGLVMLPNGLNTAQKMAARDGVPAITVFRDFDGKEQTEVIMRRFLDQAAFKARQQDGVLMMGRLRPDTLAALAIWTLADRASTVALAPASTLLLNQSTIR